MTTNLAYRRGERLLDAPASKEYPLPENGSVCAERIRPLGKRLSFAIILKEDVVSFVVGLLLHRCPAAVVFGVAGVVVLAFYAMLFGGRFAHIGVEVGEDEPAFANRDSAPAIMRVHANVRIKASVLDAGPYFVDATVAHAMRFIGHAGVNAKAPATLASSARKGVGENRGSIAAQALTQPSRRLTAAIPRYDSEPPKIFSREVDELRHKKPLRSRSSAVRDYTQVYATIA